ncbi:hypothetical protein ACFS4T_04415 [Pseudomonas lini]
MPCSCFFDGISQNVDYLATQPLIKNSDDSLKTYMSANAESIPQGESDKKRSSPFSRTWATATRPTPMPSSAPRRAVTCPGQTMPS